MSRGVAGSTGVCSIEGCTKPRHTRDLCSAHHKRLVRYGDPLAPTPAPRIRPVEERFWAKVDTDGPVPDYAPHLGPCWLWTGGAGDEGRGVFWFDGRLIPATRAAYQLLVGPIPEGLELDHLCRVPACVNPSHLEPVTHQENMRRGRFGQATHCPHGHVYDETNTVTRKDRTRACRTCIRERSRASIPSGPKELPVADPDHLGERSPAPRDNGVNDNKRRPHVEGDPRPARTSRPDAA